MATYAIGDVQGCYNALQSLLDHIAFDPATDKLWFAGDLVNRGPDSLKTLRFVKSLDDSAVTVLGNHDIHLLALYYGLRDKGKDPTLDQVLNANDVDELIIWLQQQPMLHVEDGFALVHAGLHPHWRIDTALQLAAELQTIISGLSNSPGLEQLYGPSSGEWQDAQHSSQRLRYAMNCFTRMRFCTNTGVLDFKHSCAPGEQPDDLLPWFNIPDRLNEEYSIIFGHWAALGVHCKNGVFGLDSGCVWGNCLTAMRLKDGRLFYVNCQ